MSVDLVFRELRNSDIPEIDEVYQAKPGTDRLPGLNYQIICCVVEKAGKVVGYGTVNVFSEATLLLDDILNKKEKSVAFKDLMLTAIAYSKDAGVEMLYAITKDPDFAKVLSNSYGFRSVPGTLLALDLTEKPIAED